MFCVELWMYEYIMYVNCCHSSSELDAIRFTNYRYTESKQLYIVLLKVSFYRYPELLYQ